MTETRDDTRSGNFDIDLSRERGNRFGANVVVARDAVIGKNNYFGDNCVIGLGARIGDDNRFETGVVLGTSSRERVKGPAVDKHITSNPQVVIGNACFLEPYVVVQSGLEDITEIGNDVCIGAFTHVCHDVRIAEGSTIGSRCVLAGYCVLMHRCVLGAGAIVHQRCSIGAYAMIGAGGVVIDHIAPSAKVVGVPARRCIGVNRLQLQRCGYTEDAIVTADEWLHDFCDESSVPGFLERDYRDLLDASKKWGRIRDVVPACCASNVDGGC